VLALVLAALAAPALARAGDGHTAAPHDGHHGVQLRVQPKKPTRAAAVKPATSTASNTADIPGQLNFNGGTVMHSNTVHAMYWFPAGYPIDSDWEGKVNGFLTNVAADSGKTSNVFSVTQQYGVSYSAHFAGSAVDTAPFPSSGCNYGSHGGPCLTEEQIFTELESFAKSKHWAADPDAVTGSNAQPSTAPTHLFVVYLPPGVADCFDAFGATCSANSSSPQYCAYHTAWYDDTQTFVWTNMPWSWDDPGCQAPQSPNGAEADTAIDTTSHEYIESLTDPYLDAWFDSNGYEIADKCQSTFGSALSSDPSNYNQLIHGGHYWTQLEYSNKLGDCYQLGAPVLSTISPVAALPGQTVQITGQNFYGDATVKFNGLLAQVQSQTPTSITVTVPSGNFYGTITVHAIGGTGTSATKFGYPRPHVETLSPVDGKVGTEVTITGASFTSVRALKFGSVNDGTFHVNDDGSITAHVPSNFSSGPLVLATPSGSITTTQVFQVTKVAGLAPVAAKGGALITISGQGLGSATTVDFPNHLGVPVTKAAASYVQVAVPADATGGTTLVVHTPNIDADGVATATKFNATPSISAFTHDGQAGSLVTIAGANLSDATVVKFGAVSVAASPDPSGTSVTAHTPSGFSSGVLTVFTSHGRVVTTAAFAITKVSSFTPAAALAGRVVTITGQGLGSVTTVDFAGAPGVPALAHAATSVTVRLPAAARIGPVTVHTPNIDSGGITTTRLLTPQPRITGFDATGYRVGETVTVHGSNFAEPGAYTAKLGAVAITVSVVDATTLTFTVPTTGRTAYLTFTNTAGVTTSGAPVTVRPTIDSLSPSHAAAGKKVTLFGQTFAGTKSVSFGGVKSPGFTVGADGLSVTALVPAAAVDGQITVTNAGGTTASAETFHVDPATTGFTPNSGAVGTTLTLTGTGLANVDHVDFGGGVTAAPSAQSATKLTVVVPPGATTATLTVHAGSLSVTTANKFTVTFSVTSLSKAFAPAGATVQLNGIGLTGVTSVKFGTASATIGSQTGTTLQVTVPALTSSVTVTVTKGSTTIQAPGTFGPLRVTSAAPSQVTAGGTITLQGDGLSGAAATFAGVGAPVDLTANGGSYSAEVPDGFTGGTVTVTDTYGDTVDETFALFAVASYSASHAAPGDAITITLATPEDLSSAAVKVKFNGGAAVDGSGDGNGVVTVDVPADAISGPITVSAGSSGWASGGVFTVDRATVELNEVDTAGQIELLATSDGGLGGTTIVWRANGTSHTVDLPVQTVQAGDLVVVQTAIAVGEVTIEVKSPDGIEDGLALNDGGTPSAGFQTDVASLESDGVWGSAGSFDWSTLTAGQSVTRTGSASPDDVANWSAADASIGSSN